MRSRVPALDAYQNWVQAGSQPPLSASPSASASDRIPRLRKRPRTHSTASSNHGHESESSPQPPPSKRLHVPSPQHATNPLVHQPRHAQPPASSQVHYTLHRIGLAAGVQNTRSSYMYAEPVVIEGNKGVAKEDSYSPIPVRNTLVSCGTLS